MPSSRVLIVDDEVRLTRALKTGLRMRGFPDVVTCHNGDRALELILDSSFAVVLLDLSMPGLSGQQVLSRIREANGDLPVIVVTAHRDLQTGVECMRLGATDYLTKPIDFEFLVTSLRRALTRAAPGAPDAAMPAGPQRADVYRDIVTRSPKMLAIFGYVNKIAAGAHPVLITGETGTGKELLARAIHDASARHGPMVAVNVAGLDDALFSDTLFGHGVGAFTGASEKRSGVIERAGDGTLFLDEIGELSEASQVKLLRLLQEGEYLPIGSDTPRPLRARVLAATNRPLSALREDLLFRLLGYRVSVPPLRERIGDLPMLMEHFVAEASRELGLEPPVVPPDVLAALSDYAFPGNVRELKAMVLHAVAEHSDGRLSLRSFLKQVEQTQALAASDVDSSPDVAHLPTLDQLLDAALERCGGDEIGAARLLGTTPAVVARRGTTPPQGVMTRAQLDKLERDNMLRALELAKWRISGEGGAASLLGLKPSTLSSRMKVLGIQRK